MQLCGAAISNALPKQGGCEFVCIVVSALKGTDGIYGKLVV